MNLMFWKKKPRADEDTDSPKKKRMTTRPLQWKCPISNLSQNRAVGPDKNRIFGPCPALQEITAPRGRRGRGSSGLQ